MRAFLAVFPNKDLLKSFDEVKKRLYQYKRFIRFVKTSDIHITIRYLGTFIEKSESDRLMRELKEYLIDFKKFSIKMNNLEFGFRSQKWPKILYASVFRNGSLNKLNSKINDVINDLELVKFQQYVEYNPIYHFTIGRKKKDMSRNMVNKIKSLLRKIDFSEGFIVRKLNLISSKITSNGPVYTKIDSIDFK